MSSPAPPPLNPNPNVDQIANYDGVSNDDVDWLFRGKSKKLTKKSEKEKEKEKESEKGSHPSLNGDLASPKSGSRRPSNVDPLAGKQKSAVTNLSGSIGSAQHQSLSLSPKSTVLPSTTPQNAQNAQNERISKLDKFKFGRSRSSSTSMVSSTPTEESKRRASYSHASYTEHTPDTSGNLHRSNSGRRSIFSSISSKLKAIPIAQSASSTSATTSSLVSSSPGNSHKLNPNLIGSASMTPGKQDLAGIDKPPLGHGQPRSRSSVSSSSSSASHLTGSSDRRHSEQRVHNKNRNRGPSPTKLDSVKLTRVTFAIDKLEYDPQQQIPSRRPKKGNVLIPEDLIAPPPRLSQGISLQDGGKLVQEPKYSDWELNMAIENQRRSLLDSEVHAYEAHLTAKRIATEVAQFKHKEGGRKFSVSLSKEEVEQLASKINNIEIEKPMHIHENHFDEPENKEEIDVENLSLETIYTRCCHLREILPIPATLKQLKNKTKPLQVLKLLNPKPTLIDVLSFSDFIAITPINTVIFDNVTMTTEMLKHFLASLVHNKSLEKLSLRNVAMDENGWKYLCKFLSTNTTVKKLDISQKKVKEGLHEKCIRSAMNWDLFIQACVMRGGIEELVLNGCKLSDDTFQDLFTRALQPSTMRLGLAAVELNLFKASLIASWIEDPNSKCIGVDIGFNDLSQGQLQPFIKAFNKGNLKLLFFSLNSTNLKDIDEVAELLRSLTFVQNLRFLDLSSVPNIFPNIIPKLDKYLPRFPSLRRIHLDLNELNSQAIGAMSEIFPKIKTLLHVTLLGNKTLSYSAAGTLYTAVKLSNIFCLEIEYDLIPDELSQRIAFYLMKNLDRVVNSDISTNSNNDEDLMFDGSLLMETAEKLMNEIDNNSDKKEDLKVQKIITNALLERTRSVRKEIHQQIDTLFQKRNLGALSLEGKETLLRFCLLDSSMAKMNKVFEEQAKINGFLVESTPVSPSISNNDTQDSPNTGIENIPKIDLHESSTELITAGPILSPHNSKLNTQHYFPAIDHTFQPHQVVTETSGGKDVAVDNLTGRPVLIRSISQTSTHARELEEEEGELHKLAVFIQQREKENASGKRLLQIPTGSELRDAIIAAKGIESVDDLIDKVNSKSVSIDKILGRVPSTDENGQKDTASSNPEEGSIDSGENALDLKATHIQDTVVDEVYDQLLNDAQRVRSSSNYE